MKIKMGTIKDIVDINDRIDNSYNGTCFAYDWFLKLKKSNKILRIYDNDKLIGFMPIFSSNNPNKVIFQSTMYIPYGGPVLFDVPTEERHKIKYIRSIEKELINYLQKKYTELDFSVDTKITDIMPFIRSGFTIENRYTYKLDLGIGLENLYEKFGHDRRKDIRKAFNKELKFIVDDKMKYFDPNEAMKWEKNYGSESTVKETEKYIKKTLEKERGMCFVALDEDIVIGGVHIAWDKNTAYILYSYYERKNDDIAIAFLYYKIFEYLIANKIVRYIDFEGSVFESIEDWNISFGAYQERFYNLHWNKLGKTYPNIYDYGEK